MDMFEKINAHSDAVRQEERQRKEDNRRARRADRRMFRAFAAVVVSWVLVIVLSACGQISKALAEFLATWAGVTLAIWLGAWIQFRFCREGLMK